MRASTGRFAPEAGGSRRIPWAAAGAPAIFLLTGLLLVGDLIVAGRAPVPAEFLAAMQPWGDGLPPEREREWNVLAWDGMAEFLPWRDYAAREFRVGRIPLWNSHVLCGTPLLANSQSAPLYPLHAFLCLPGLPRPAALLSWLALLHLALAGWFAWLLARDLGLAPAAALAAGLAFETSGFAVSWLALPSFLAAGCWIPLAVLYARRCGVEPSARSCAAGGLAVGMMLLGGHLQIGLYGLMAAGVGWLTGFLVRPRASPLRAVSAGAGLAAVGLLVALPQVLPALELSRMSHRAAAPGEAGLRAYLELALPPQQWVAFLAPDYFGLPARGDFWGFWSYGAPNSMEYAGYVALPALLLALPALLASGPSRPLGVGLAVLGLLLAAGSPLTRLLYFGLPGFAQTGSPARALALACLGLSLLAGHGAGRVLDEAGPEWRRAAGRVAAGAAALLVLLWGLHLLTPALLPEEFRRVGRQAGEAALPAVLRATGTVVATAARSLLGLWLLRANPAGQRRAATAAFLMLGVLGGGVLAAAHRIPSSPVDRIYPPTPLTTFLEGQRTRVGTLNREWDLLRPPRALLPPNASLYYGWREAQGYDSLMLGRYRAFLARLLRPEDPSPPQNGNIAFLKHVASPLQPLLAAGLLASRTELRRDGLERVRPDLPAPPYLYRDRRALPEAYVATTWIAAADEEGFHFLARTLRRPGERPAVVAPVGVGPRSGGGSVSSTAVLERAAPGRLLVRTSGDGGLLVIAEAYAPGWRARVPHPGRPPQPVRVQRANLAFMGIPIPPGESEIELRYEPASFRAGLFLGLVGVAVSLGILVAGRVSDRCGPTEAVR